MGIYRSWSVWFLALNLETPTKRLEFLVTACFAIYEHVIYVTNCNNIPTKICHVSPKKSQKNHHGALLRLVRFTISETSAYFFLFPARMPDAKAAMIETIRHVCLASEKVQPEMT